MDNIMTLDDFCAVFNAERAYHSDWPSSFALALSPTLMALLELYHRHPQARRSMRPQFTEQARIRSPDWRRPLTPLRARGWLDQKQLASGEKPDDD